MKDNVNLGLRDMLDNFLDTNDIDGAFFLKGKWGTGKTYFIKEYTNNRHDKESRKYLYISLNGVSSLEEINKDILSQLHPKFHKFKNHKLAKLAFGIVRNISFNGASIGGNLNDLNMDCLFSDVEGDLVLIFDDLERCQIGIVQVLGFINQFVEEKGFKVIVIGNDEEICNYKSNNERNQENLVAAILSLNKINQEEINGQTGNSNVIFEELLKKENNNKFILESISKEIKAIDYYSIIKEKVFGIEYDYRFDKKIILDFFGDYLKEYDLCENEFIELIDVLKCENIRSYIMAKYNIEKYIKKDLSFVSYSKEIKKVIILNIIIETIWYKNPRLLSEPKVYSNDIIEHKINYNQKYYLIKFIHIYVFTGFLDNNSIGKLIPKLEEIISKEQGINKYQSLASLKYKSVFDYEDAEFKNMLEQLYDDLINLRIPFNYYFDCFRYFYYFEKDFKFESETINCNNFYNILKTNLSKQSEKICYNENEIYFEDRKELKEEFLKIQKLFDEWNEKNVSVALSKDLQECKGGFSYKNYEQISIKMKTFLGLFEMDILKEFIATSSNEDLRDFFNAMIRIYEISNASELYSSDMNYLQEVFGFIEEIYESAGNIRKVILDSAKNKITKILKNMEK